MPTEEVQVPEVVDKSSMTYSDGIKSIIDISRETIKSHVLNYWSIGEIIDVLMQSKEGSGYGDKIFDKIAEDIASNNNMGINLKKSSLYHAHKVFTNIPSECVRELSERGVGLKNVFLLSSATLSKAPDIQEEVIKGVIDGKIPQNNIRDAIQDKLGTPPKKDDPMSGISVTDTAAIKTLKAAPKYIDVLCEKLGGVVDAVDVLAGSADVDDEYVKELLAELYDANTALVASWQLIDNPLRKSFAKLVPKETE